MLVIGQLLGEFEILGQLGQGGMGAVYKARQTVLRRIVAIKTLQPSLSADPDFVARFHNEAVAAAALNHPNLVQVYSAGCTEGIHWFAMEFVDGETIQTRLKRLGKLAPMEAVAICMHVATALEFGWRKAHLIHRDIKPDNIFLSHEGEVKLGDLGLAKSSDQQHGLTVTGASMGTPLYISPEQAEGARAVDFRTDIYSLGATLFHLVAGTPPFHGESAVSVLLKHVTAPVPNLQEIDPSLPPALAWVIAKMMQKSAADRYASYAELNDDLRSVYEGRWEAPNTASPTPKRDSDSTDSAEPSRAQPAAKDKQSKTSRSARRMPRWVPASVAGVAVSAALVWFFFAPRQSGTSARKDPAVPPGPLRELIGKLEAKLLAVPGENALLSRTEFTVGEWKLYAAAARLPNWEAPPEFPQTDEHPVVNISLADAKKLCSWLSAQTGQAWRLPTEKEWESAAGTGIYPWGDDFPPGKQSGNYALTESGRNDPKQIGVDGYHGTAPVGSFPPNANGFVDMGGNATEWTDDGIVEGQPVLRGGSWMDPEFHHLVGPEFFKTRHRRPGGGGSGTKARGFRIAKAPFPEANASPRAGAPAQISGAAKASAADLIQQLEAKLLPIPGTKVRMGKTEVTEGEWDLYLGLAGLPPRESPKEKLQSIRKQKLPYEGLNPWKPDENHPVSWIEWDDARNFCRWLSKVSGRKWRLPLNAEWEAAACPDGRWELLSPADAHFEKTGENGPVAVGSFRANTLGFHDLLGNVWEWMDDRETATDLPVLRGGGWRVPREAVTPEFLMKRAPATHAQVRHRGGADIGLRLVQAP
jgi:formylglycine-generating enzyme required for sulfatase activity/serine/threonine protein kinase